MFEAATRNKYRFPSTVGALTVEDLWDLPLINKRGASLDDVAKTIYKELKDSEDQVSFVRKESAASSELSTKLDIVKYVIDVKMAEQDARVQAKERKEKKEKIMSIIAQKEDEQLKEANLDDLKKMMEEL
jgi:hypothetical protein